MRLKLFYLTYRFLHVAAKMISESGIVIICEIVALIISPKLNLITYRSIAMLSTPTLLPHASQPT